MIKNVRAWEEWESNGPLSEPPDFQRNLKLLNAMAEEARLLNRFQFQDPLEGLEVRIRLARMMNVRPGSGADRSGA